MSDLTQARLKELLSYDPATGVFVWIKARARQVLVGSVAGTVGERGYRRIIIKGKNYRAHRLAWLYVYGEWPDSELDHINRDKLDNRISNLRIVTRSENLQNTDIRKNNTSGTKGVWLNKIRQKWVASVTINNKYKHLGHFDTIEEAIAVRRAAEKEFYSLPESGSE